VHASKWLISRVVYKNSECDTAMFLMNIRVLSQCYGVFVRRAIACRQISMILDVDNHLLWTNGDASGRASDLQLADHVFESWLGATAQWPWASYIHLYASAIKQYNLVLAKRQWCCLAGKITVDQVES